jgi:hypothetical protein
LKIELLSEEGIEKKSDRDLKEYILQIISEHSEMIKKESLKNIELTEELISFNKFEKEIVKIEKKLGKLKESLKNGGSKEQFEKLKKINSYLESL